MKSPMFEARVEGLQPRFYSERSRLARLCLAYLCAFVRAMLIGGSIAVAWERVHTNSAWIGACLGVGL